MHCCAARDLKAYVNAARVNHVRKLRCQQRKGVKCKPPKSSMNGFSLNIHVSCDVQYCNKIIVCYSANAAIGLVAVALAVGL